MEVRRATLGATGAHGPLLDLAPACELARAAVRECRLSARDGGLEALLIPHRGDAFAITVDPTPRGGWRRCPPPLREALRRHRLRFRIGHELGHTFFYWREGGEPERHLRDSPAQERFCDAFARALLVPAEALAERPVTADSIVTLQREFDVSLEVAARAMADAHPGTAVALWHWSGTRPQLQWASNADADGIPRYAIPPDAVRLTERRQALLCRASA